MEKAEMRVPRRALKCPLAVPEKIFGLTLILDFFDRCAQPCSLVPPQAALAGFARNDRHYYTDIEPHSPSSVG